MSGSFPPLARAAELLGGEIQGEQILCPGPGHSDGDRSLAVKPSTEDPEGFTVHSFAGDHWKPCRKLVRKKCGLPEPKSTKQKNGGGEPWKLVAEYIYRTASGEPYLCVRKMLDGDGKKQYPQHHWDGTGWARGAPAGAKIPFRLPELLAAPLSTTIYVAEGEKCVLALANLRFVATTNSGGAAGDKDGDKKWTAELNAYFAGRNVVIIGDNDAPGRRHVQYVARQLHGIAESIRVLDLAEHWPGGDMPEHYDVADFLAEHDLSGSKLAKLAKESPLWDPASADKDADKAKAKEGETEDEVKPDGDSDGDDDENKAVRRKQADILVELAETATLFHTAAGDGFADVDVSGHRETHRIRSRTFRSWLVHQYYMTTKGAPNSDAMQSALNVLEARALFEGVAREVHLRVAEHEGKVYVDLADPQWRAVEIGADGWWTVAAPPVRFRRTQGMLPLPEPERGGSIDALRSLLNVKDEADFVLVVAWLLTALRGRGPFPVLVVSGEQGAAKTSFCTILRAIVDPFSVSGRAPPRSDHDLHIAANSSYLPMFDNLSVLPLWVSDTLSRLSTGGGFTCRRLFSDDEEILFHAVRPILLNGIPDVVVQPDLMSRSILLTLEGVSDEKRREKDEVDNELNRELPRLLGVLLDGVAHGLRKLPDIKPTKLPRMADFARWGAACEGAFGWPAGTFAAAYAANRERAVGLTLEADTVAMSVRLLMSDRTAWTGTASDLLSALGLLVTESQRRGKGWPTLPHHLSGRLRRAAPALRKVGIEVEFIREGRDRTRLVRLTTRAIPQEEGNSASAASAASIDNDISDLPRTGPGEVASASASAGRPQGSADAQVDAQAEATDHPNPLKNQQMDAGDAADAHLHTRRGGAEDDDLFPTFLRRCNHCGKLGTAGEPLRDWEWAGRPDGILLHERCEVPWHDRESERGAV